MAKVFKFRGKSLEEIQKLDLSEFAQLLPSRERRTLLRGMSDEMKRLLHHMQKDKKKIRTHCREMIIIPEMVGKAVQVHNGKDWVIINIVAEMMGHRLGEFSLTRKTIKHSSPGIGATRSSASLSVR